MGQQLGRYTLLRRLAVGGMGEIYLATVNGLSGVQAPLVLKVLRDEFTRDQDFVDMLVDEANICRFLNHQNVVSVSDFGEADGTYFIAMEYVQGVTLEQVVKTLRRQKKRMPLGLSLYIQLELCRALRHAHTRKNYEGEQLNIIHRDVTPANLLLSVHGEVKLSDFGIARAKGKNHKTQAGMLKGKFGYMAPELIRQESIDARADIFCAGVVFYELLTSRHPVQDGSLIETISAFEQGTYKPPSAFNKQLPKEVDDLVMNALKPNPVDRIGSAEDFGNSLQQLVLQKEELRNMVTNGANYLAKLIKKIDPTVFEDPIPQLARSAPTDSPPSVTPDPLAVVAPDPRANSSEINDTSETPTALALQSDSTHEFAPDLATTGPVGLASENASYSLSEDETIDGSELSEEDRALLAQAGENQRNPAENQQFSDKIAPSAQTPLLAGLEVRPIFEEGVISTPARDTENDYDDGPTAFTPHPDVEAISQVLDSTASNSLQDESSPNETYEQEQQDFADSTLLDGLSVADLEAEKKRIEDLEKEAAAAATPQPNATPDQTDENFDATQIRLEINPLEEPSSALAQVSATAKNLSGPLRVKVTPENTPNEKQAAPLEISSTPNQAAEDGGLLATAQSQPGLTAPQQGAHPSIGLLDTVSPMPSSQLHSSGSRPTMPARVPRNIEQAANVAQSDNHSDSEDQDFRTKLQQTSPVFSSSHSALQSSPNASVVTDDTAKKSGILLPFVTVLVVLAVVAISFALISDKFWPKVTITSSPNNASVILNGRKTNAKTPITLKLKPFVQHVISAEIDGYNSAKEQYRGNLLEQKVVEIKLIADQRFVLIKPVNGRLFVNNRKIGDGEKIELPPLDALGQIEIKVEATGYNIWTRVFRSADDIPHQLKVRLIEK
ncbi:MAG: protein kinase [Myxococcota bacterium]|nr:protein kinase [Myxococcota bacterium]